MRRMQPTAPGTSNRFDRRLDGLRDHPTLGRPIRLYLRHREQILYLVIGAWNTLFGYAMWALMQYLLGDYLPYYCRDLALVADRRAKHYICYRYIVFRSRGSVLRELPRFSLVYLVTLVVNLALLPVALRVLPFNIYVIQALFTAGVVVCSYLGHKYYSFGGERLRDTADMPFYDPPPARKN